MVHTLHAKLSSLSLVGVCFKLASLRSLKEKRKKEECLAGEGIRPSGLDMSGVDGPLTWSIKRPADRRKLFFFLIGLAEREKKIYTVT